jgi:cathepsin B
MLKKALVVMAQIVFLLSLVLFCVDGKINFANTFENERRAHDIARRVNEMEGASWTAAVYAEAASLSQDEKRKFFLGVLDGEASDEKAGEPLKKKIPSLGVPSDWDWRTGNKSLSTCVGSIQNQLKCGSCWAVSAVEVLADRRCIAMRQAQPGAARIQMSALDLVACDKMCKFITRCCRGCAGGYPSLAWKFIQEKGVVSSECMPYNLTKSLLCPVPKCFGTREQQKAYKVKKYAKIYGGAPSIRREIFQSGPVQATFSVYEDFMNYHSGIYKHVTGKLLGLHAVKVVGFGYDRNSSTAYWSVANSWGETWGNQGFFKIAVGQCEFELNMYTATPCTSNSTYFC